MDARIADLSPATTERDIRVELAAAYRLVDYFGWCELFYGHLTARVPGSESHFLINPYGLNYDEVTASNLVKIDVDGNVVEDSPYPVNKAGFVIHSAIHMVQDSDNHVVMHTHTRAGMAIAALEEGLLPISMNATMFHERLSYHDYEGPSFYLDERERLQQSLGRNKALILRNHGLLTTGQTVPEAFMRLYRLERSAQVQIDAGAAGKLRLVGDNVAARSRDDVESFIADGTHNGGGLDYGRLEFAALMRKLDRIDPGYRD
ncbi:MAG: class II aldolase/adducin family protein [Alphaproteobacteria bacterium]|nr:class II aldolase/adducin family protein [Alphaproteobacteria bacterium]MCB9927914.1 class II aldolase/adducin family protein [Alphaproteobacteria bacterium]